MRHKQTNERREERTNDVRSKYKQPESIFNKSWRILIIFSSIMNHENESQSNSSICSDDIGSNDMKNPRIGFADTRCQACVYVRKSSRIHLR